MKTKLIISALIVLLACNAFQVNPTPEAIPGWIYLASGDGAIIQAAIDSGLPGNRSGKTIVLAQGTWDITEPLRINNREGVTLIGSGNSLSGTVLRCNTPDLPCIEILGTDNIILQNINITGVDAAVLVMTARTLTNLNSSRIEFRDLYTYGQYDYAAFYNVSSESNHWINVHASAQNPDAVSVITIAGYNEYGIQTSIPISEGVGGYLPIIERSGLTGQSRVPLRVFGLGVEVRDSYLYTPNGNASIELIGKGWLRVESSGFEGAPFATIRLTRDDGFQDYFSLNIDSGLGNPAQYGIWADDGTVVHESVISGTGLKPLRFADLVYVDLTRWAKFDSRANSITATGCFGVNVALGQQDTLFCTRYIGVTVENQSSFWSPKMEYLGFVE